MKRNPEYVKQYLKEMDDGSIVTLRDCMVQFPERYVGKHLASFGNETHVFGFFALIMDGNYSVCRTIAKFRMHPSSEERENIDGEIYVNLKFDKGDILIHNTDVVKDDRLVYEAYDYFIDHGNIPWFIDYIDMAKLFDTAGNIAGMPLGNRSIMSLIISTVCRDPNDLTRLYRHIYQKPTDPLTNPPTYVEFRSVIWNTTDTTSKLIGAYTTDSFVSALVNKSERIERIETLLRR